MFNIVRGGVWQVIGLLSWLKLNAPGSYETVCHVKCVQLRDAATHSKLAVRISIRC